VEVWVKPLVNNEWGICFFNHSDNVSEATFDWNSHVIKDKDFGYEISFSKDNPYKIRDLYLNKEIGNTKKSLKIVLEKNQSLVVRMHK
jgi:alpha-galactosidase